MPDGDALPPPERKRKTWLWVVIGVLGACLILCCAGVVVANTSWGQDQLSGLQTSIADYATEAAPKPTARP